MSNIFIRFVTSFSVNLFILQNISEGIFTDFSWRDCPFAVRDTIFFRLSFSSDLWEAYGVLEFNFIPYQINNRATSKFAPYVFIGLAVFKVSPKVTGRELSVLESDLTAVSIPFGVGIKFNFSGNLGLGIEWGMRKTYTDKIDGLREKYDDGYQLSNTQNNDWYSIIGLTLNYKILTHKDR